MSNGDCPVGAANSTAIKSLEKGLESHERVLNEVRKDIKEIRDNLSSRPTWSVAIVVTILCTLCTGMAVYLITHWSILQQVAN